MAAQVTMAMGDTASSSTQFRNGTTRTHKRKPRKALSCEPCRSSKLKCDRGHPCGTCKNRECEEICTYVRARQTLTAQLGDSDSSPRRVIGLGSVGFSLPLESTQNAVETGTSWVDDIPTGQTQDSVSSWENVLRRPVAEQRETNSTSGIIPCSLVFGPEVSAEQLLARLPSRQCCDFLVSHYFSHLSALFPILHGLKFQQQYTEFFEQPLGASLSWLALLFVICSISLLSIESNDPILIEIWSDQLGSEGLDTVRLAHRLRSDALACLSQVQFVIHHDLNTLEALLILIYTISHNEGVERGWTFLGMALNIGIALRCNIEYKGPPTVERERRRRCWAGILMLHTYQGILFRDIKMSFLLEMDVSPPSEIQEDSRTGMVAHPENHLSGLSLMKFKKRLFQISTNICAHISGPLQTDVARLEHFDSLISEEEKLWDSTFLVDGNPSILDSFSYVHWCVLQTYSHQLYLLIHRPFYNSRSPHFRAASREKCLKSSVALLDVHREISECPRLRYYRWLVNGMASFNALHAAVALASCLLDMSSSSDCATYMSVFDSAVSRLESLQSRSLVCLKACPILRQLRLQLSEHFDKPELNPQSEREPDDWADNIDWLNPESSNWILWDEILDTFSSH